MKKEQVQNYIWDNKKQGMAIKYTDEEKQKCLRLGIPVIEMSIRDWYANDVVFKHSDIEELYNNGVPIINILAIQQVQLLGDVMSVIIYVPKTKLTGTIEFLRNILARSIYAMNIRYAGNNVKLSVPLSFFGEDNVIKYFKANKYNFEYRRIAANKSITQELRKSSAGYMVSDTADSNRLKVLSDIRKIEKYWK